MFPLVTPSPDTKIILLLVSRLSIAFEDLHVRSNKYLTFAKNTLSVHIFLSSFDCQIRYRKISSTIVSAIFSVSFTHTFPRKYCSVAARHQRWNLCNNVYKCASDMSGRKSPSCSCLAWRNIRVSTVVTPRRISRGFQQHGGPRASRPCR